MGVTHRLERTSGGSTQVFELRVVGRQIAIREGTPGALRERTKTFLTAHRAGVAALDLLEVMRRDGYRDFADIGSPAGTLARNAELEAALRVDRDDLAPYLVYADWLQQHGNPYGELIVLAARKDAASQERRHAILDGLRLPSADLVEIRWRHGLWSSLAIDNRLGVDAFDVGAFARGLFGETACCALQRLAIGSLGLERDYLDTPAVLQAAIGHAWARDLVELAVGEVDPQIDMAHHAVGDVGPSITRAFPNLRSLFVHSGEYPWHDDVETFGIAGLDLPRLEHLVVETCSMSKARIAALFAGNLPAVTELELWFGSTNYNATATVSDLRPLLDGRVMPRVVELGLRNAEHTDELATELGKLAIAPRLVALDLSMGTLTDDGALALAASARQFARLETLDVDDNFLTERGLAALRAAFPDVVSQRQKPDEGYRYVSVAE